MLLVCLVFGKVFVGAVKSFPFGKSESSRLLVHFKDISGFLIRLNFCTTTSLKIEQNVEYSCNVFTTPGSLKHFHRNANLEPQYL